MNVPAASHPFERFVAALHDQGCLNARGCFHRPGRARALCPAHRDQRPSLSITRKEDKVLIRCFAGCRTKDVVAELGLRLADLFSGRPLPTARPTVLATYDYVDGNGVLEARKLRFSNKAFRWCSPTEDAAGWRSGLFGATPGLYRSPELVNRRQVFLNEGEKATDLLWGRGLPATCPPSGAAKWSDDWSRQLWALGCRELVILADNDRPGQQHAERVAASAHGLQCSEPLAVKVITLPGLQVGADAFDWFEAGHTATDLLTVASTASYWAPGARERERAERRRAQTRERVRRHRAKDQPHPLSMAS